MFLDFHEAFVEAQSGANIDLYNRNLATLLSSEGVIGKLTSYLELNILVNDVILFKNDMFEDLDLSLSAL